MKKIILLLSLSTILACSSDDSSAPLVVNNADVSGTWRQVAVQSEGEWVDVSQCAGSMPAMEFIFNNDGSMAIYDYCENVDLPEAGTYTVSGDVVTITINGETDTYLIAPVDGTHMFMTSFYTSEGTTITTGKWKMEKQE